MHLHFRAARLLRPPLTVDRETNEVDLMVQRVGLDEPVAVLLEKFSMPVGFDAVLQSIR